jgi:hypothetical protein
MVPSRLPWGGELHTSSCWPESKTAAILFSKKKKRNKMPRAAAELMMDGQ